MREGASGRRWGLLLVCVLVTGGCSYYVSRAARAYVDGRYLEAAEELAAREPDLPRLRAAQQVRYGLVRGLSLLQLGEYEGARRWMRYAYEVEARQTQPTLAAQQRAELDTGWGRLRRLGYARTAPPSGPPR